MKNNDYNETVVAVVKKGLNKGFLHLRKGDEFVLGSNDVKSWQERGYITMMSKPDDFEIIDNTYISVYVVQKTYTEIPAKILKTHV